MLMRLREAGRPAVLTYAAISVLSGEVLTDQSVGKPSWEGSLFVFTRC